MRMPRMGPWPSVVNTGLAATMVGPDGSMTTPLNALSGFKVDMNVRCPKTALARPEGNVVHVRFWRSNARPRRMRPERSTIATTLMPSCENDVSLASPANEGFWPSTNR
jgi:hypothetical protein